MSHEIRTPMIGVTGMLEALSHSGLKPQQRHMVGTAQGSAASLLQIIGDVLDLSKIEAGKLEVVPTTFAIATSRRGRRGNVLSHCVRQRAPALVERR